MRQGKGDLAQIVFVIYPITHNTPAIPKWLRDGRIAEHRVI